MDQLPAFLRFRPAPVRTRHDGWTPATQLRFILLLARGAGPAEAARGVGRSRQTAYALRARPGAEAFAAAWDAALAFAADVRQAARAPALMNDNGIESMLVPRFYRGRLVGFVQREDHRAVMRTLARLDRLAGPLEATGVDGIPFETILEAICPSAPSETDKADGKGP